MREKNKVLIIKHGALGDFILSLGPCASIRKHHSRDHIVLLTSSAFKDFANDSNYFDEIIIDNRPSIWNLNKMLGLCRQLRRKNFYRVYDLQTSTRSNFYYNFFRFKREPLMEWSGTALGCSHPDNYRNRNQIHTIERHKQQLNDIGIANIKLTDLSWVKNNRNFNIQSPYIIISPGSSSHRLKKRWSEQNYAFIAKKFINKGITPVVIGKKEDYEIAKFICMNATGCVNLLDETTIQDICVLSRDANLAIGNDTGPMHAIAMSGCNTLVLFSNDSNPIRCAPRTTNKRKIIKIIQHDDLRKLSKETVVNVLDNDFGYNL
tara:strand:- start:786 stop:1745 length:960 start_codon:yes stop_codon:yes gene_type:complete